MASVTALREGLADRLNTISRMQAHAQVPGQISGMAAIVDVESIRFDSTFARGSDDFTFVVTALVSSGVDKPSQQQLDALLDGDGANTVKGAIEGDPTLGGVADFAHVAGVRRYGLIDYAGQQYLGAELLVEVTA